MSEKERVLILCTGDSCRPQMAEGWINERLESVALEQSGRNLDGMARAVDLLAEGKFQEGRAALTEWPQTSSRLETTRQRPLP